MCLCLVNQWEAKTRYILRLHICKFQVTFPEAAKDQDSPASQVTGGWDGVYRTNS